MTDDPVELDEHRGMAAQKSTEIRRHLHAVKADQTALRSRQEEFERHAIAAPSAVGPRLPKRRSISSNFSLRRPRRGAHVGKS